VLVGPGAWAREKRNVKPRRGFGPRAWSSASLRYQESVFTEDVGRFQGGDRPAIRRTTRRSAAGGCCRLTGGPTDQTRRLRPSRKSTGPGSPKRTLDERSSRSSDREKRALRTHRGGGRPRSRSSLQGRVSATRRREEDLKNDFSRSRRRTGHRGTVKRIGGGGIAIVDPAGWEPQAARAEAHDPEGKTPAAVGDPRGGPGGGRKGSKPRARGPSASWSRTRRSSS